MTSHSSSARMAAPNSDNPSVGHSQGKRHTTGSIVFQLQPMSSLQLTVGFPESRTAGGPFTRLSGSNRADWLLNLPSQFQIYLILTIGLLYNSLSRWSLYLFSSPQRYLFRCQRKLDTPGEQISKEAVKW